MTIKPWLSDVVVVNESSAEAFAGDISIFRSVGEACSHLEHWWVEEGHGSAYTATGERISLDTKGGAVIAIKCEAVPGGEAIVLNWLRHSAAAVLDARKIKAAKRKATLGNSEQDGILPDSVEGLIAYIGFMN